MTWRVILGTITIVGTLLLFGLVAVTEPDRMSDFDLSYNSRTIENGAAIFENNCKICHGANGQGVPAKGPALNVVELFNGARTDEAKWAGTVDNFIRLTIAAGRPRPSSYYASQTFIDPMPTWREDYGGPLRKDQVDALTAFIMNWGEAFKDDSGNFPIGTPTPLADAVGRDLAVTLPAGDATRGADVAKAKACTVCHVDTAVGPSWLASAAPEGTGISARAEERLTDPNYKGNATTAELYLLESIILPSAYIVPGNPAYVAASGQSVMAANFPETLTQQEVADIIAYMLTIK